MRPLFLPLVLVLVGCDSSSDGYLYPPVTGPSNVLHMDIDTGAAALEHNPATDAPAVLIEYQAGGTWNVSTTCDTTASGYSCNWDLVLSLDAGHDLTVLDDKTDLESGDRVLTIDQGAVRAIFETESDVDQITLTSPPGDTLQIDGLLDGYLFDPACKTSLPCGYISWTSGGNATNAGSNPVQLTPTAP